MKSNQSIYPVERTFNKDALIRGFNRWSGVKNLGGPADECELVDLIIAGQYKEESSEGLVYRVVSVYRHIPSNTNGMLLNDITEQLLSDMEATGSDQE